MVTPKTGNETKKEITLNRTERHQDHEEVGNYRPEFCESNFSSLSDLQFHQKNCSLEITVS
jgi:hypothetical protein